MRLFCLILLTVFVASNSAAFEKLEHFEDRVRIHMLVYKAEEPIDLLAVQNHAEKLRTELGESAMVYYFDADATRPISGLTAAPNYLTALRIVIDHEGDDWSYSAVISPKGDFLVTDCTSANLAARCR